MIVVDVLRIGRTTDRADTAPPRPADAEL